MLLFEYGNTEVCKSSNLFSNLLYNILSNTEIYKHDHPEVRFIYYQIVSKYYTLYDIYPNIYEKVILSFLNDKGIKSNEKFLKSNLPNTFIKLCKNTIKLMKNCVETVLNALSVLYIYILKAVLYIPSNTNDNIIQYYEILGILLNANYIPDNNKLTIFNAYLDPIITNTNSLLLNSNNNIDEKSPQCIIIIILDIAVYNVLCIASNIMHNLKCIPQIIKEPLSVYIFR